MMYHSRMGASFFLGMLISMLVLQEVVMGFAILSPKLNQQQWRLWNDGSTTTRTTTQLNAKPKASSKKTEKPAIKAQDWTQHIEAAREPLSHVVPKKSLTRKKINRQGVPTDNHPKKTAGAPPLKILGGSCRGRRLFSPPVHLRPMMGKVREAVYSTFTYFELYQPTLSGGSAPYCRHLDIFAGSGSVGLESMSRGATHCTFVDMAPECCQTVERNLELLEFSDTANVVCADALDFLRNPAPYLGTPPGVAPTPYQLVTLCPPYEEIVYADLMDAIANSDLITDDTVILIEYPIELGCLPHVYDRKEGGKLIGLRNRRYGRTVVALYICNPTGKLPAAESRPEEFISL